MRPSVTLLLGLLLCGLPAQDEVAFIKYYANERDFLANNPLLATARDKNPYLQVSFNETQQPILKSWVNSQGEITRQEMFGYDNDRKLVKRVTLNADQQPVQLIYYGEQEPWSVVFREYLYPPPTKLTFTDQQSLFFLSPDGRINRIQFLTIDRVPYGEIYLAYDRLGYLSEERWVQLPQGAVVRIFKYAYDIMTKIQQIWEYGRGNQLVSHVALTQAPAEALYKEPPPRTGNILDEVGIILEELRTQRILTPLPTLIPQMEQDRLILINGDVLMVELLGIDEEEVRFRLNKDPAVLRIPLDRVASVTTRFGQVVYP